MIGLRYIGGIICHQLSSKTFSSATFRCWLCFRCSGVYLGFIIGMVSHLLSNRKVILSWVVILVSLVFIIVCFFHAVILPKIQKVENNFVTFFTGILCGVGLGLILSPIFQCNFVRKKDKGTLMKKLLIQKSISPLFWVGVISPVTLLIFWRSTVSVWFINITSFLGFLILGIILNSIAINKIIQLLLKHPIPTKILFGVSFLVFASEIAIIERIK